MDDVYYHPEKSGLVTVGEVEWSDGCYQFDMSVVWRNASGSLLYGEDSGCSCPVPFEATRLADLEPVTVAELQEKLNARNTGNYDGDKSAQIAELMLAVTS